MKTFLNRTVPLSAIAFLPTFLFSLSFSQPASANNAFDKCVTQLIETGITGDEAGTACADALVPKDLSECVGNITEATPIDPQTSLKACYQVRRPVELSDCVVDIHQDTLQVSAPEPSDTPESSPEVEETSQPEATETETPPEANKANVAQTTPAEPTVESEPTVEPDPSISLVALDSCRRSLLPKRYSECVIALNRNIEGMLPETAMATCLSAEDFPRDLFPEYSGE